MSFLNFLILTVFKTSSSCIRLILDRATTGFQVSIAHTQFEKNQQKKLVRIINIEERFEPHIFSFRKQCWANLPTSLQHVSQIIIIKFRIKNRLELFLTTKIQYLIHRFQICATTLFSLVHCAVFRSYFALAVYQNSLMTKK